MTAGSGLRTILLAVAGMILLCGCATLPENVNRPESFAYTDMGDTVIGRERPTVRSQLLYGEAHPDTLTLQIQMAIL